MDDRDHFAAAALTGLMQFTIDAARPGAYVKSTAAIAADAYELADAMLRERNGAVESRETVQSGRPSGVSDAWAAAANQQLRERGYYGSSPRSTNHDAVPEAKADLPDERPPNAVSANGGTPCAASRDGSGTGNTQEPVAWAVMADDWFHDVRLSREGAEWYSNYLNNKAGKEKCRVIPLYRRPQQRCEST